ncbi:hypothetical protein chiPu_0029216, partial [Chiloscyllium punctatum]|nr:hypothetical protein [Chiloscyllium punctatum]
VQVPLTSHCTSDSLSLSLSLSYPPSPDSQWRGEVKAGLPDWSEPERAALSDELSDVLIYLVRLAEKCNVDLPRAVLRKMELNRRKYPADQVRGSSRKYTEYAEAGCPSAGGAATPDNSPSATR